MNLIINTTGEEVQVFGINNPIRLFVYLFVDLLNKTIVYIDISNKLLVFIYYSSGFY